MYTTRRGELLMMWSSFRRSSKGMAGPGGEMLSYVVGMARSTTGQIEGPWVQEPTLWEEDGGHGMLFRTAEGELRLALHSPNTAPEHPIFLPVEEVDGRLRVMMGQRKGGGGELDGGLSPLGRFV
mmetsp:Transcript_69089/g.218515  ORF Transcript_69089/g.218515 Transcript_69089/m.218515 type:complete len:125 (-) Transcript_69089:215-589(-)